MEGVVTSSCPSYPEARILSVGFTLCSPEEVQLHSANDCAINYPSQLMNPFLGLPVESGKCEACGTLEPGECEGHFGYIELPTPIFHPHHVSEIKRILNKICLHCLNVKKRMEKQTDVSSSTKISGISCLPCSKCQMFPVLLKEAKNIDGALCLELKFPKGKEPDWSFLDRYGYRYPNTPCRPLLPYEALQILENLPQETIDALARRGCFAQSGLVLKRLPVPPNCLLIPDLPDAISSMSSDPAIAVLRRILTKADIIKKSRSDIVNFESHEIESSDLQAACAQYMQHRGAAKAPKTIEKKHRVSKEMNVYAKAWLEKIRTLFIRKGSGFSSRSVITGDAYKGINEIGLPLDIARKITFEERVTSINRDKLQTFVDKGLCLAYRDGLCKYAMRESLKMSQSLKIGQAIDRRIMDGDVVFINRPPSTHKHSLQAFSVYIHDDCVVKINPLICGALGADFDGDCIHIYYPQSFAAKAEVQELFAVEKQLLSSHNGSLNVQLVHDSVLAAKLMYKDFFLDKAHAQQLMMWTSAQLIEPAVIKADGVGPFWTFLQVLQTSLPELLDCCGQRFAICKSEILEFEINRGQLETCLQEIFKAIIVMKGPSEEIRVFNLLQPLLMEILFSHGCSVGLNDFYIPQAIVDDIGRHLQDLTPLLHFMRSTNNELVESQIESYLKEVRRPVVQFISKSSSLGFLVDTNSDQSLNKVVQQLGFLGLQLYSRGRYYSNDLVDYLISHSQQKYVEGNQYSPESLGLVGGCLFNGLNPFEDLIHSVASREGIVRSSRGLTEPGLLFKNLMAILRDVTICYDGTVRNICTNAIVQFVYSTRMGPVHDVSSSAGEPVGVLAATAVSNPAYKAVLESSPSNNSSWDSMKEILFCKPNSKNDHVDSRVIIYLKDCGCARTYCKEQAAVVVRNHLQRKTLKDLAAEFMVEFQNEVTLPHCSGTVPGLVGHIHLDKMRFDSSGCTIHEILHECENVMKLFEKKNHPLHQFYLKIALDAREHCGLNLASRKNSLQPPCLQFSYIDKNGALYGGCIEKTLKIFSNAICPTLLKTVVQGDPRIDMVTIFWVNPSSTSWVKNPMNAQSGELALEVVIHKGALKNKGDAWRIAMDSCLPVMPLIDTTRCIPYGIQQIQERLGIACAFDQSVKRLSSSMQNVAKGVLKEHLILVGSSMSGTGSLIGFNTSGYKSLFRTFDVPVPFMEATLYAPMKCFEKAAERCHNDSLSSVVASCSWGKRVTLGTGAPFEITWTNNQVDQTEYANVYNFLQLVRKRPSDREVSTLCLGADVDDLDDENRSMDFLGSPEHLSNGEKFSFDDNTEDMWNSEDNQITEKEGFEKSGWPTGSTLPATSNGWGDWGNDIQTDTAKGSQWSTKESSWSGCEKTTSTAWGRQESNGWGDWGSEVQTDADKVSQLTTKESSWSICEKAAPSAWGGEESNGCGDRGIQTDAAKASQLTTKESSWPGCEKATPSARGGQESHGWGDWGNEIQTDAEKVSQLTTKESPWSGCEKVIPSAWGRQESDNEQVIQVDQQVEASGWPNQKEFQNQKQDGLCSVHSSCSPWSKKYEQANTSLGGGWGSQYEHISQMDQQLEESRWAHSGSAEKQTPDKAPADAAMEGHGLGLWNHNELENHESGNLDSLCGRSQKDEPMSNKLEAWKYESTTEGQHNEAHSAQSYLETSASPKELSSLSAPQSWGSSDTNMKWKGSTEARETCEKGKVVQRRPHPPGFAFKPRKTFRPSTITNTTGHQICTGSSQADQSGEISENINKAGQFTATGKPFAMFMEEEGKILADVEPLVLAIRRILHDASYKDGDRLNPEDQKFVLENIFHYHPDKASKISDSIDFIMIDAHSTYKETRCLHIVSTNGCSADFSYLKCIENFVLEKYPENAGAFNKKYFAKKRHADGQSNVGTPRDKAHA